MTAADHTPSRGRYIHGCRCDGCRAAAARYQYTRRRARELERRIVDGRYIAVGVPHGRPSSYNNHGCRCEPCTEAIRAYNRTRPRRAQAS